MLKHYYPKTSRKGRLTRYGLTALTPLASLVLSTWDEL